jgi:hypothetical protein
LLQKLKYTQRLQSLSETYSVAHVWYFRNVQAETSKATSWPGLSWGHINTTETSQGCLLRSKTKWRNSIRIEGRSRRPDKRFISFPVASITQSPAILYWTISMPAGTVARHTAETKQCRESTAPELRTPWTRAFVLILRGCDTTSMSFIYLFICLWRCVLSEALRLVVW